MKRCRKCNENKEDFCFRKDTRSRDGLKSWCKFCENESAKAYQAKNIEKVRKNANDYGKAHPEKHAKWLRENKQYVLDYAKKYRERNKDRRRIWMQNRRMRVANAKGDGWTLEDEIKLKEDYFGICVYCGEKKEAFD